MASGGIKAPAALDFVNAQESWNDWIQRFQRYRFASGLEEKAVQRQIDTLIYIMGDQAEKVYTQLEVQQPTEEQVTANAHQLFDNTVRAFTEYFNPTNNQLHYSIMMSNCQQKKGQSNEEFIRELYEIAGKCGFQETEKTLMLKMRLLAGMSDKSLARELQLDSEVSIATIKSKMHAKETILKNQQKHIDGEKALVSI